MTSQLCDLTGCCHVYIFVRKSTLPSVLWAVGPVCAWTTLPITLNKARGEEPTTPDSKDASPELRAAIVDTLPMFTLPEGASSRKRGDRGGAGVRVARPPRHAFQLEVRNESRFILPVGQKGEVSLGSDLPAAAAAASRRRHDASQPY